LFKYEEFGDLVVNFQYILFDVRRYKDSDLLELERLKVVLEKLKGISSEDEFIYV